MAGTCPHGIAAGECLICRTLSPAPAARQAPVGPGRRTSPLLRAAGVVAVLAVIAVAVWLVVGAVFAVLHVLELVLVAVAAGWAGYRVGMARGARRGRGSPSP